MAPRKKVNKELSKKLAVYLADFDKQCKIHATETERAGGNLLQQINNYFTQEIYKIPKAEREMKIDEFLVGNRRSVNTMLRQIEEEVANEIHLPVVLQKLHHGVKTAEKPSGPPSLPGASVKASGPPPSGPGVKTVVKSSGLPPSLADIEMVETPSVPAASAACLPKTQSLDKTTVYRQPEPNEMVWSGQGSPMVIDPRAALSQSRIKAAIKLKDFTIAMTASPTVDEDKYANLDSSDLAEMEKLQQKLARIVELNKSKPEQENNEGRTFEFDEDDA